jgi:hypothetical protein
VDVIGAEILNMITALRSFSSSLTELEFGRTDPSDSGNCLVGNHWITLHLGTVPQAAEVFFGIVSNQGFENLEELSLYFERELSQQSKIIESEEIWQWVGCFHRATPENFFNIAASHAF